MSFIEFDESEIKEKSIATVSQSKAEVEIHKEQEVVNTISNETDKQKAQNSLDAKKAILCTSRSDARASACP